MGDGSDADSPQCVPVDATSPSRLPFRRLVALLVACASFSAAPALAQGADLIQLNGDPPITLQGVSNYGLLYLDGVVRLSGDTGINATDVFIGPDAQLQTCYDIATDDGSTLAEFGDPRALGAPLPLWIVIGHDGKVAHYHTGFYDIKPDEGLKQLDDAVVEALRRQKAK